MARDSKESLVNRTLNSGLIGQRPRKGQKSNIKAPASKRHQKLVFAFGKSTEGRADMRSLLGGKGANLAEMASIGLPVPPGFTISTRVCNAFYENNGAYPSGLSKTVEKEIVNLEIQMNRGFGDPIDPLLLSVRSGAPESMPGMMDTILNLGLNDETVKGLALKTGNKRFAYDCYRRFIQMYGSVVLGVRAANDSSEDPFNEILSHIKGEADVEDDMDLEVDALVNLVKKYKSLIKKRCGKEFPQDVYEQLWGAVSAVFGSWKNERAVLYRQRYGIPTSSGTAVNIQTMVFGNLGQNSGTGVAFTRNPANGEKQLYGEYLINAQGEDVVSGVRTPNPISQMKKDLPENYKKLVRIQRRLEKHFRDMQDFEFTIENGALFLLQTRNGKRTGVAAVRIAVDMNKERLMDQKTALLKIPAESIDALLVPIFDPNAIKNVRQVGRGLPAGPGAASGKIVFSSDKARYEVKLGNRVILCRMETSPDDLKGMLISEGVLTTRGGVSSHAALVARQLGKVCVCGAADALINYRRKEMVINGKKLKEGDELSIDGSTGAIYAESIPTVSSEVERVLAGRGRKKALPGSNYHLFQTVMKWADKYRRLRVRTNADTPIMSKQAINYGAEGIGLCRTEHMFFDEGRIDLMRRMILAATEKERRASLKKLLPYQRRDFRGLFQSMAGRPVTIRLLDPPLHEFLPGDTKLQREMAKRLDMSLGEVKKRMDVLHEENPMLGCRGCRLGILYPEITEMQVRAIFEAAKQVMLKDGNPPVRPEIMVPLVGFSSELADQVSVVRRVAEDVMKESGVQIDYQVGTMIEVPRAVVTAAEIAEVADFFSFGTNDLTQMTLGLSRDDMGAFFESYTQKEIYDSNPFVSIDESGVGRLILYAVEQGKSARSDLKLGICGEHGGDPASIAFCHGAGLAYVSCSPPRVPVARLAAAQAALLDPN